LGQRLVVNSFTVVNGSSTAKDDYRSQRHSSYAKFGVLLDATSDTAQVAIMRLRRW
jgi:hypothetical protein